MPEPLRYQNPELQELLASNYVAGTLRGAARRRMEALMRDNTAISQRVRQWESKLQPLHEVTAPVTPKVATWQSISESINGATEPLIETLKRRLNIYKYLTAVAMTFALVAGVLLWVPQAQKAPGSASGINYVAVMKDQQEQPTMVVTLTKEGRVLALDMLKKPKLEADQQLQLWAVSRDDGSIKSLGAVGVEKHIETSLSKEQWGLISSAEFLLVSAENQINVQAPGEQIIAKGLCVKVEGWKSS